jgi:negative regulator of sigma E activity
MADIMDLDWDDMIETMPATEEAIKIARARRVQAAFEAEEAPTRPIRILQSAPLSHEKEGR